MLGFAQALQSGSQSLNLNPEHLEHPHTGFVLGLLFLTLQFVSFCFTLLPLTPLSISITPIPPYLSSINMKMPPLFCSYIEIWETM